MSSNNQKPPKKDNNYLVRMFFTSLLTLLLAGCSIDLGISGFELKEFELKIQKDNPIFKLIEKWKNSK